MLACKHTCAWWRPTVIWALILCLSIRYRQFLRGLACRRHERSQATYMYGIDRTVRFSCAHAQLSCKACVDRDMSPIIPADLSYALCQPPSFDVPPDTDIFLGTILRETDTRPKRPDTREPLNCGQTPPDDSLVRSAPDDKEVILHTQTLRTNSGGIWAHVDFLPGIGGRFGAEKSREQEVLIYAQNVKTRYFNPTPEFMAKALNIDPVKDQLDDFHRPVVYMVTGVKVAEKASIVTGMKKMAGAEVGPEIDLSQFGIPVSVGADVVHNSATATRCTLCENNPLFWRMRRDRSKSREGSIRRSCSGTSQYLTARPRAMRKKTCWMTWILPW